MYEWKKIISAKRGSPSPSPPQKKQTKNKKPHTDMTNKQELFFLVNVSSHFFIFFWQDTLDNKYMNTNKLDFINSKCKSWKCFIIITGDTFYWLLLTMFFFNHLKRLKTLKSDVHASNYLQFKPIYHYNSATLICNNFNYHLLEYS